MDSLTKKVSANNSNLRNKFKQAIKARVVKTQIKMREEFKAIDHGKAFGAPRKVEKQIDPEEQKLKEQRDIDAALLFKDV